MRTVLSLLVMVVAYGLTVPASTAQPIAPERDIDPLDVFEDVRFDDEIPTPEHALGHSIGHAFTRSHAIIDYSEQLADASDRVRLDYYGESHLGRDLLTLTISSPENLERLDEILEANRLLADPRRTTRAEAGRIASENQPAIVWFSFGVHGNEGSCSEVGLAMAYALAAGQGGPIEGWLEDLVIVIDPNLNPDGRERYISWFEGVSGQEPNARRDAAERFEPWPGGRTNHYLFDLNRDWVWGVHPESNSRVRWYRQFLPQLHIDWHEQGFRSPHFFGEGDTPYSMNIPRATREWLDVYTSDVAGAFDAKGLVYATRERFDYLYPGYGKVLPCYHGAVGILNEQGGHSFGGLAVEVTDDYTLTLAERVRNQMVVARSYLETTRQKREGQLERFHAFFADAMEPSADAMAGYVVEADNDPLLLKRLWELCDLHGIEVYATRRGATLREALCYEAGAMHEDVRIDAGSWVIPTAQPMGALVRTLFERSPAIEDPDTYDITAWSLPVMFGLETWRAPSLDGLSMDRYSGAGMNERTPRTRVSGVGLAVRSDQHDFPVALGLCTELDVFARLTGEDSSYGDVDLPAGSLIVHRLRNEPEVMDELATRLSRAGLETVALPSGLTDEGPVMGANANRWMVNPKIAVLRGSPTSSYSFGQLWHLMDVEMPVAHTVVLADRLSRVNLDDFNVLVLPEAWGGLSGAMDEDRIKQWIRDGGTLVALGSSARWATREIGGVESNDDERTDAGASDAYGSPGEGEDEAEEEVVLSEMSYAERKAKGVEDRVPGAMFRADVDTTHPIAFGAPEWIGVIKRNNRTLDVADSGYVVARFAPFEIHEERDGRRYGTPLIGGAASEDNAETIAGTPFVTHHIVGRGNLICFGDDITLRGFNHAAMRLLMNAITKGPSLAPALQPLGPEGDDSER